MLRAIRRALHDPSAIARDELSSTHPIRGLYDTTRSALARIDKLRPALSPAEQSILDEATSALHRAEDAVHEPYWRGDLRG